LRYFLTLPGGVDEFNRMDGNRGRFVERQAFGVGIVNNSYVPVISAPANQRHLRLVEFTGALPKYRLAGAVEPAPDTPAGYAAALARLAAPDFNPASNAILHTDAAADQATADTAPSAAPAPVAVLEETPVDVRLRVTTGRPAWLIRSAKYDPAWQATVDAAATPLRRANFLFQAVHVPAGTHDVAFSYRPGARNLYVAAGARLALLLMLAWWAWANRPVEAPRAA
jgi:hypothetical protein